MRAVVVWIAQSGGGDELNDNRGNPDDARRAAIARSEGGYEPYAACAAVPEGWAERAVPVWVRREVQEVLREGVMAIEAGSKFQADRAARMVAASCLTEELERCGCGVDEYDFMAANAEHVLGLIRVTMARESMGV